MEVVRSRLGPNQVSQRRLCRVLGQSRSTQRYRRRKPDDDRRLIDELRRWCEWYPRFGSERVHQMLLGTGWRVNFKRVHRLWKQEHFQVPGKATKTASFTGAQRQRLRPPSRLCTAITSGATTSSWIARRMAGS